MTALTRVRLGEVPGTGWELQEGDTEEEPF